MVSIYQEAINRAAAEAAEKAEAKIRAEIKAEVAEATNKTREESVFENALILSKKLHIRESVTYYTTRTISDLLMMR